jgi:hypothetical protein
MENNVKMDLKEIELEDGLICIRTYTYFNGGFS